MGEVKIFPNNDLEGGSSIKVENEISVEELQNNNGEENKFSVEEFRVMIAREEKSKGGLLMKHQDDFKPVSKKRRLDTSEDHKLDECELYGDLITMRLEGFDELTRLSVMHEIDNVIFKTRLKLLKRSSN